MSEINVNDNEIAELEALSLELMASFAADSEKRAKSLELSKARQAWYVKNTLDFQPNTSKGIFTVIRRVFENDAPAGYDAVYFIQIAVVSPDGRVAYRPSGLFMVGVKGETYRVMTTTGKFPLSRDAAKVDLSVNLVKKAIRLSHLFGKSHRAEFAANQREAFFTRS